MKSESSKYLSGSDAINLLEEGKKLSRIGWGTKGAYIQLQSPDENSKMTRPYVYITIPAGNSEQFGENGEKENRIPWNFSQTDLFAKDWQIIN